MIQPKKRTRGGGGPKSRKFCERNKWIPPNAPDFGMHFKQNISTFSPLTPLQMRTSFMDGTLMDTVSTISSAGLSNLHPFKWTHSVQAMALAPEFSLRKPLQALHGAFEVSSGIKLQLMICLCQVYLEHVIAKYKGRDSQHFLNLSLTFNLIG